MAEQYRVRLADGQLVEMARSPAAIRRDFPGSRIEGRVVVDELGQGRVVPFQGEQPIDDEVAVLVTTDEAKPEEPTVVRKKAG